MLAHPILYWETIAMAFSTAGTSRGDGLSSEINVTPLIDVLLVMLIIFMVIVPVMPRGLNSALPSPATAGIAEPADRPVLVQVEQGPDGCAVSGGRSRHGESRGRSAAGGAFVAPIRSPGAAQGGRQAGLRRHCWSDRRRSGCGSGERRIGDSRI